MKPTVEQVHRALFNYYKPLRTPDVKLRDTVQHAEKSRAINPAQDISTDENHDVSGVGEHRNKNRVSVTNYTSPE